MCGINGIVRKKISLTLSSDIHKMNNLIIHRGPDDEGVYLSDDKVALGMRRLSIIDLTYGKQPIFNEDKSKVIVFNGEIYNYKDLQLKLISKGYKLKTNSDTEVVLALYELYGEECVEYLNGMFAFAIYDQSKSLLFIARDRFGEKPLYYYHSEEELVFASELKSLVFLDSSFKKISNTALQLYFSLSYIPAPHTIYDNIYKLEPATKLVINTDTLELVKNKYWDIKIDEKKSEDLTINYNLAKKKVTDLVFDSVERRMVSDVPIGVFLSGGVDSAIVASVMSKLRDSKIQTFTIGLDDKRYDESSRALKIANHINSDHIHCPLNYDKILHDIDEVILNFDEPFADPSSLPTYFVSKHTSKFVKVALTGDGGDEVFGGYNKYLIQTTGKHLRPYIPLKSIKSFFNNSYFNNLDSKSRIVKLQKFFNSLDANSMSSHLNIIQLAFRNEELNEILNTDKFLEIRKALLSTIEPIPRSINSDLQIARYIDFKVSLEGDLLPKVDRTSMLASLECRAPFLDHRLVDLSFSLPDKFLIKGNNKKRILKEAFEWAVPKNYFNSPKSGFEIPIGRWFRNELKSDLINYLSEDYLKTHGLINVEYTRVILNEHLSGSYDHSWKIWTIYCFQKWYFEIYLKP
jgi:asparagine synthase (glutamine-hydrolysing)